MEGYRRQRFRKFRSNREITFSSLDFSGLLTVKDTDLFGSVLFRGLGPAKGFGCGLMLVRRA